ncbi:MAG: hypothetical protein AAF533_09810 [Acidobacteriota bacterium]
MARIAVATVVGALILFIWGYLTWVAVPLHMPTINALPNEAAVTTALTSQNIETGAYVIPWSNDSSDWENPESQWHKNHLAGPLYTIYYHRDGDQVMSPKIFAGGFIIDIIAAFIAAMLLHLALPLPKGYLGRVGFVAAIGLLMAVYAHGGYWNWMRFPTDYTVAWVLDLAIGWTLVGLAFGKIITGRTEPAVEA